MNERSSSDEIIRMNSGDEHCMAIFVDWQRFVGRQLTAHDFCPSQVQRYLAALSEVLTAEDIQEVRSKIVSAWRRAYVCGIIATSPEDLRPDNTLQ